MKRRGTRPKLCFASEPLDGPAEHDDAPRTKTCAKSTSKTHVWPIDFPWPTDFDKACEAEAVRMAARTLQDMVREIEAYSTSAAKPICRRKYKKWPLDGYFSYAPCWGIPPPPCRGCGSYRYCCQCTFDQMHPALASANFSYVPPASSPPLAAANAEHETGYSRPAPAAARTARPYISKAATDGRRKAHERKLHKAAQGTVPLAEMIPFAKRARPPPRETG